MLDKTNHDCKPYTVSLLTNDDKPLGDLESLIYIGEDKKVTINQKEYTG